MRTKRLFFSLLPLWGLLTLLGVGEGILRVRPVSPELARVMFFNALKIARWSFLSELGEERLAIPEDDVYDPYRSETTVEEPERARPPFDRIPHKYEVYWNNLGFRDTDFPEAPKPDQQRIIVLGDSVAFGKGVQSGQSFPDLIEMELEGVEVFNLALMGCTAECMARLFTRYADLLQPDLLVVQASGNDLDQILWAESEASRLPGMGIGALRLVSRSFLLQWLMQRSGRDHTEAQFALASEATARRYKGAIRRLLDDAGQRGVPVVTLDLPYAYGLHYGEHLAAQCEDRPEVCKGGVRVDFVVDRPDGPDDEADEHTGLDFFSKTAAYIGLSDKELEPVIPNREWFHDVCHLSPRGHRVVANGLLPELKLLLD